MNAYVFIVATSVIIGLLPIIWRSKGVYILLLISAGSLLSMSAGNKLFDLVSKQTGQGDDWVKILVRAGIIVLPALLGILITKGTVKRKKLIFHLVPSLIAGILTYLWLLGVLPLDVFSELEKNSINKQLLNYRDVIMSIGLLSVLVVMFIERPKRDDKKITKH